MPEGSVREGTQNVQTVSGLTRSVDGVSVEGPRRIKNDAEELRIVILRDQLGANRRQTTKLFVPRREKGHQT